MSRHGRSFGSTDPSSPPDGHGSAAGFDEVAGSLRNETLRVANADTNDPGEEAVAWLRPMMETLDLALLVKEPEPG
ncbi:MAG: hypothetical protein ACE5GC_09320 [Acidimicrobiia bacterium]